MPAPDPAAGFRCGHVAIVGRPSVGKSTLLNALVGEKISITSKKPQTTRHRITGIATDAAAQFVFVDTPGFQTRHRSRLNDRLNRAVRESLAAVDVVVLVLDATRLTGADRDVAKLLPDGVPAIAAVNKVDLLRRQGGAAAATAGDRARCTRSPRSCRFRRTAASSSTRSRTSCASCCRSRRRSTRRTS